MPEPQSLHETAVDANQALEQLATGLSQAGVDPQVVETVTKMAKVTTKIIKILGKGQEATGDGEPPAPAPEGQAPDQAAPAPAAAPRPTMDQAIEAHQAEVAKRRPAPA